MLSRPALLRPAAAKRRGFTLLELIVVLLILGILAAIAIPTFNRIQANSVKSSVTTDAEAIARNANGIAASQNGGKVTQAILNLAAAEAYGWTVANGVATVPASAPTTGNSGPGKDVTAASSGSPTLTIAYTSGSTKCVIGIEVPASGVNLDKAVVDTVPTSASQNCPDQATA